MERGGIKSNNCGRWEGDNGGDILLGGSRIFMSTNRNALLQIVSCMTKARGVERKIPNCYILIHGARNLPAYENVYHGANRQIKKITWQWVITAPNMQPFIIAGRGLETAASSVSHNNATCIQHLGPVSCIAAFIFFARQWSFSTAHLHLTGLDAVRVVKKAGFTGETAPSQDTRIDVFASSSFQLSRAPQSNIGDTSCTVSPKIKVVFLIFSNIL